MSIDESFYKNVLLLTQLVPPSYEFTRHFRRNMFDKSNTLGFLHVSHYLLELYDAERFKLMVQWPIFCKKAESTYRNEVKNYLMILSNENPDFEFPHIRMSDLLQARGIRFLNIMWKLSGIVLRAYIERECRIYLLRAPKVGLADNLTERNLRAIIADKNLSTNAQYRCLEEMSETVHNFVKLDFDDVHATKMRIIELKQNIQKLLCTAPVNSFLKERLENVNDTEIVTMWKVSVLRNLEYIHESNMALQKLCELSSTLCSMINSYFAHSKILDGRVHLKQSTESGKNEKPQILTILISFNLVLDRLLCYLRLNPMPNLNECQPSVEDGCKVVTSAQNELLPILSLISAKIRAMQNDLREKNFNSTLQSNIPFSFCKDLLASPPKIMFKSHAYTINEKLLQNQLCPSPETEPYSYKKLFARHKRMQSEVTSRSPSRLTFDSAAWSSLYDLKTPPRSLSVSQQDFSMALSSVSPQYSRLFQTNRSKRDFIRENNMASTPNNPKAHSTGTQEKLQKRNEKDVKLTKAAKKIFNLSCEITNTLESLYKTKNNTTSPFLKDERNLPRIKINKCLAYRINDTR